MNTVQHTCATLFAVALAGEENYWLCEPATSRPLQSDWKSTPCRWLYPVDISLDRFAKMSGFDTTDSVFELGMEGVSRVEKYATLACDIKAKRQKENGTIYFFVPHQEIARIDERYKLLLKKEQQELQRQLERKHQQLYEKLQKQDTDGALHQDENEKCLAHIEFSNHNGKSMPINDEKKINLTQHLEMQQTRNVESIDSTLQNIPNHESNNKNNLPLDAQLQEERKVDANFKVERVDSPEVPIKQEIKEETDKKHERKSTTLKRRRKNLSSASSQLTKRNRSTCGQRLEVGEGNRESNPFTWKEYYVLRRKRGNAYLCQYAIGNSYGYRLTKVEHYPFTLFILFGNETHNYFNVNVSERCIPVSCSAVLHCNNNKNNIDSISTSAANVTATSDKGNNFVTHSRECINEHSALVLVCNEEALRKKNNCHALEYKLANDKNSKLIYDKYNQRNKRHNIEREPYYEEESEEDQIDDYNEEKESFSEESMEEEENYENNEEWERSQQHPHQELEEWEYEEEEEEEFEHFNREDKELARKAGSRRRAYRSDKNASRLNKRIKTERNELNDNKKQSNHLERTNRRTFNKNSANMTDHEDEQEFIRGQYVDYPNELKEAAVLETVEVNMWSDAVESVPTVHAMTLQHPFALDETKDYNTAVFPDGTCVTYTPASYARVMAKREQILQEQHNTSHTTDRASSKFTESEVDDTLYSSLDLTKTHDDTKEDVILSKKSNVQTNYNQKHGAAVQSCNDDDDMRVLLNNIELAKEQINFDLHK